MSEVVRISVNSGYCPTSYYMWNGEFNFGMHNSFKKTNFYNQVCLKVCGEEKCDFNIMKQEGVNNDCWDKAFSPEYEKDLVEKMKQYFKADYVKSVLK